MIVFCTEAYDSGVISSFDCDSSCTKKLLFLPPLDCPSFLYPAKNTSNSFLV